MTEFDIKDRKQYPDMAHWFSPGLLAKLLLKVIVSDTFGQYADRRLVLAALDTVSADEHLKRAKILLDPDKEGATWVDFVADLGDGFDATYAIATLLAKDELTLDGMTLPRGKTLIMGGDEVYPAASADAYRLQLVHPYKFALSDLSPRPEKGIPLYAIPGNHDWYDGLVMFLAFFCREKALRVGRWRSQQRRSYFALNLTDQWWLWCTDIQLAEDMDQPQADYFKTIAERMPENSKIILCSAEPGWLYTHKNKKSFAIADYTAGIASAANRNLSIPILLSGDTHHYSRYASTDGVQFVTSGGGGAFLHPTHQLEDEIKLTWLGKARTLSLKTHPTHGGPTETPACYPPRKTSRDLLWGNLWFAVTNWDFTILMGLIYWMFAVAINFRDQWDAYIITFLIFFVSLTKYTQYQERSSSPKIYIVGLLHGLAHALAAIALARFFSVVNAGLLSGQWYDIWVWLTALLVEIGITGGLVGATLFGLNLLITCRYLRMNENDAFSAMRLDSYRHFLRIRIKGNEVRIYPIGLDKVPVRSQWRKNPDAAGGRSDQPLYLADPPLQPHLIEQPIVVRV